MIATLLVSTIVVYGMLRMVGRPSVWWSVLLGLFITIGLTVGFASPLVVAISSVTAYLLFRHRRRVVAVAVRVFHSS